MKRDKAPVGWEAIFQAIEHPALILDPHYNVVAANSASIRLTGKAPDEIIGRKCHELFHGPGADTPPKSCPMQKMLASDCLEPMAMELEMLGSYFHISCTPVFDEQGNLDKIVHIATDLSELKQAEEELHLQSEIVNKMDEGVSLIRADDQTIVYANPKFQKMLGYAHSEILGLKMSAINAPTKRPRKEIAEEIIDALKKNNTWSGEVLNIRKDGSTFWSFANVSRFYHAVHGDVYLAVQTDITKRKRAEEAMRENEIRLRAIFENSLDAIGLSKNIVNISVNPAYLALFGYSSSNELAGASLLELIAPGERERIQEYTEKRTRGESVPSAYETRGLRKDGAEFDMEVHVSSYRLDGEIYTLVILRDITGRKQAETALLEAQQFSANLLRDSSIAAFVLDRSHRIMLWNKACEELTGRRESEMIGTDDQWKPFYGDKRPTVADVIIDQDLDVLPALYKNYTQSALNPRGIKVEGWYSNLGGKDRYIVFDASPIYSRTGELIAALETLQDFTESKRLEEQLLQSQKVEAIGILAGGVAHDFNNILSAIVGYSHLTITKMSADDPLRGNLEHIIQASERATTLTQSLLSFSRKQIINPKPSSLNDIVKKFEKFLTRLIREDITISTTCAGGDLTIFADSGQIEQLLMNLVTNARDAMPRGGAITLQTRSVLFDKQFIEAHGFGKAGRYALLTVSDIGEGIDAKTIKRIFDPFYTTKEQGKGTGLGLSMVYGIVKQHNGYIDVYSEPGKGATFNVYLPLLAGVAAEEQSEAEYIPAKGGSETILIAEDDESIRELFSTILRHHGYHVILAVNGEDAVIKFNENRDRVQLAILDGIMPKKNGKETYEEILAINPSLKAIFVSGYAEDIISRQGLLEQGINFIQKPVAPSALLNKVREVLDA